MSTQYDPSRFEPGEPRPENENLRAADSRSDGVEHVMTDNGSADRARATPAWLCRYDSSRPHSALGGKPPISRIAKDNLLGSDS